MTSLKNSKKTINAISQAVHDVDPLTSLKMKLKTADPEIQNYIAALEAENLKGQRKVGNLQAEIVSLNSRITILEENLNEKPNLASIVANVLNKREHDKPPKK